MKNQKWIVTTTTIIHIMSYPLSDHGQYELSMSHPMMRLRV